MHYKLVFGKLTFIVKVTRQAENKSSSLCFKSSNCQLFQVPISSSLLCNFSFYFSWIVNFPCVGCDNKAPKSLVRF